jgi:hypothetical protein
LPRRGTYENFPRPLYRILSGAKDPLDRAATKPSAKDLGLETAVVFRSL